MPAKFDVFQPVLLTLIERAKATNPETRPQLLDRQEWRRIWTRAVSADSAAYTKLPCPYPGLAPYGSADKDLFFGRDQETAGLVQLVAESRQPDGSGSLAVLVGASGAGKSSLLHAGLVPALTAPPQQWHIKTLTPGPDPVATLHTALRAAPAETVVYPQRLVVVDQAEELFTQCHDEDQRRAFLAALTQLSGPGESMPTTVILAIRADFYARCLEYPLMEDALRNRSYLLGPMRREDLAVVICGPWEIAGGKIEPGLAELAVTELCGIRAAAEGHSYDAGALPLLSHLMVAAWDRREGQHLTIAGYRAAGGVLGAVAATAEQAWASLSPLQKEAARSLLLRLVAVSQDGHDTRRTVLRQELDTDAAAEVALEALAAARLVTLDTNSVYLTHEIVLEVWPRLRSWIAQDRDLLLASRRVEADATDWAATGNDRALLYRGARLTVVRQQLGRWPGDSPAAEFLAASVALRHRESAWKGAIILASVVLLIVAMVAYGRAELAAQERSNSTYAALLDNADRVRATDPTLSAQLELAAYRHPSASEPEARARLLGTQNLPLARTLRGHQGAVNQVAYLNQGRTLASASTDGTVRLWDVADLPNPRPLGEPLAGKSGWVHTVSASPGSDLLAAGTDRTVQLWSIRNLERPAPITELRMDGPVSAIAFSPRDPVMATATGSSIKLWEVTDPARPKLISAQGWAHGAIRSMTFSANGNLLGTSSENTLTPGDFAAVQLWDTTKPSAMRPLGGPFGQLAKGALSITFSPDATLLAIGSGDYPRQTGAGGEGVFQLWDISVPARPQPIGGPTVTGRSADLRAIAFSPDGYTLVAGSSNGAAVWNIADAAHPKAIGAPLSGRSVGCETGADICGGDPTSLVFSPDGRTVAMASASSLIQLWSLPPAILSGQTGDVYGANFSADGSRMITGAAGGDTQLWDTRAPQAVRRLRSPGRTSTFIPALSPDGRTAAQPSSSGAPLQLLDVSNPAHYQVLTALPHAEAALFRPDQRVLFTVTNGTSFQLYDVADQSRPRPLSAPVLACAGTLTYAEFSADSRILLTMGHERLSGPGSGHEAVIKLWAVSDPARPQLLSSIAGRGAELGLVATMSADSRTLGTAGLDALQLWDISDPRTVVRRGQPARTADAKISSMAFSPDGRLIATGGQDSSVQLWDVAARTQQLQPIGGSIAPPSAHIWNVNFHPAGRYLVGTGSAGALRMWDLDAGHAIARICGVTRSTLTDAVWKHYLPQLPYQSPCP